MKQIFLFLLLIFLSLSALAQSDDGEVNEEAEVILNTDTLDKEVYVDTLGVGFWRKLLAPTYPNPERAAALSFVVPGAGQVYNKKFWYIKVPVIYAGYAFLIQRGEGNRTLRNTYQENYLLALDNQPLDPQFVDRNLSASQLRIRRDQFDKNFQLSYIGVVILHFIQTLEAYTTAHLLKFDMDESLTISPTLFPPDPMGFGGSRPGITVGIQLGK